MVSDVQSKLLVVASDLARRAGQCLIEMQDRARKSAVTKGNDNDWVSDADRASEEIIVNGILHERPHDCVVGEEGSSIKGTSDIVWIVDPLDGTSNYLRCIGPYGVSIGIRDDAGSLVSVIFDPQRNELFSAIRNEGAFCNGQQMHASGTTDLERAFVCTGGFPDSATKGELAEFLTRLIPEVGEMRRLGSASIQLAAVASGRADGYITFNVARWDLAAGAHLVEEAGGVIEVEHPDDDRSGVVIAGTPSIMNQLRSLVC